MGKIKPRIIRVNSDRLILDSKNPRLPESIAKGEQKQIQNHMKKAYDLEELAFSMVENGYFEAEPLVVIPEKGDIKTKQDYENYHEDQTNKFIVAEGNRRLATIIGLKNNEFPGIPASPNLISEFTDLPVLFYPSRDEVLRFLGVHHLAGVRKWDVYERARYIVQLKRDKGYTLEDIQKIIGDRKNSSKKTYACYRLIEIIEEYDESLDTKDAKSNFSFLQLATGQGPIKDYIGLPAWKDIKDWDDPIPTDKKEKLKFLFRCLFDSKKYGNSLIKESRDITNKLNLIFADAEATADLEQGENINSSFDMIGGEFHALAKYSKSARDNLEKINGKLSGMKIENVLFHDVGTELKKNIESILYITEDINKKFSNE